MVAIAQSSLALLLVVAAASSSVSQAAGNLRQRNLQTYTQSDDYFATMLARVNEERAAQGLSALCTNKKLQAAAQGHSDDQAANNYMDHTGSDGSTMSERITAAGYDWSAVAENVAAGQVDVDAVMTAWMNSEGHRENILGDYTMFGTAYAYNADSTYKHYWTQDFGTGSTEECDDGSSASTSSQQSVAQDEDEVQGEASTTQQTESPATEAPATEAPTTESPATVAPSTEAPATEAPATEAPVETPAAETTAPTTASPKGKDCATKF